MLHIHLFSTDSITYLSSCLFVFLAGSWKESRKWYRLASRQGWAEACVLLGHMYANGEGVPSNAKVACKHYRVAAEKGDVVGMYELGKTLCEGGGKRMAPNPKAGVPWLRKASRLDSKAADRFLESMVLLDSPQKGKRSGHSMH